MAPGHESNLKEEKTIDLLGSVDLVVMLILEEACKQNSSTNPSGDNREGEQVSRRSSLDSDTAKKSREDEDPEECLYDDTNASDSSSYYYSSSDDETFAYISRLPEDEDGQEIQKSAHASSTRTEFIHFYDKKMSRVYHTRRAAIGHLLEPSDPESDEHAAEPVPDLESANIDPDTEQEAVTCLNRVLRRKAGFGPPGYEEWLARKLGANLTSLKTFELPFPQYWALCQCCKSVLSNSLIVYAYLYHALFTRGVCKKSIIGYSPQSEVFSHHRWTRALDKSASAGCHLCSLLVSSLAQSDTVSEGDCNMPYLLEVEKGPRFCVQVKGRDHLDVPIYGPEPRYANSDWKSTALGTNHATLKHPYTGAPDVGKLARGWLEECLSQHDECFVHPCAARSSLPTRLVRVVASNGVVESANLVCGADLPSDTRYLTLSHCWGGLNITTLTKKSLHVFQSGIPLDSLTKTFRDAFQVTLWLEHQYLWIDSLCILQDSEEDWKAESASMGSVYSNSTCTIAAIGAKDGSEGLFFNRSAAAVTACPLFQIGSDKAYAVDSRTYPQPLLKRGWVFQEQCLSLRTLRFGIDQVSWLCPAGKCSETGLPPDDPFSPESPLAIFMSLMKGDNEGAEFRRPGPVYRQWKQLVEQYTELSLTRAEDRWPAIQGLSKEVESTVDYKLVHGLWSADLASQLMWKTKEPGKEKNRLESGEPSWSWLSVVGAVDTSRYSRVYASVQVHGEADEILCIESYMYRLSVAQTGLVFEKKATLHPPQSNGSEVNFKTDWYPDIVPNEGWNTWAVQLEQRLFPIPSEDVKIELHVIGLVVIPVETQPGYWRRVGTYELYEVISEHECPDFWRTFPFWRRDTPNINLI